MSSPITIRFVKLALFLLLIFVAQTSLAATLSVSPNTAVYTAGQTFTARVVVNTAGQKINAAEGTLSFKPTELSVIRVTKGSVFNLWTSEPSFSNTAGTISFSGGTPTGYSGSSGTVLSITFRVKGAGNPRVTFKNGAVLAADGRGTNVLTSMNGASYTITAAEVIPEPETIEYIAPANTPAQPKITSSTHPDPTGWYATTTAQLSWVLPKDATAVRTLLDENSGSIPTKVYDSPISSITINDLDQGVQYFHLQFKNKDGWGKVAHYRLAVDTQKPDSFTLSLPDNADLNNPKQTVQLEVSDATSEVKKYLVQIDGGEAYEFVDEDTTKVLKLPALEPGRHTVIVEAFDAADNSIISTLAFEILSFDRPKFTEYPNELSQEVIPVIKGMTRPNAEVRISVTKIGEDTQEYVVKSSETGEFVYIPNNKFSLGVYELTAVAIDQYGAQSEVSDPVRIAVQEPGYIRIGSLALSILSVFVPLFALFVLFFIGFWFLWRRLRVMRSGVTKETKEALQILKKEFDALHSVVANQSKELAETRKTKKLTKAESHLISTIETALLEAQKKVQKEITDVEDIVD